ncbi:MAG: DegT/DnrJ/EryC1/StrS family aminotransferase [Candidatus Aminicenantes bacterium]|nr:DegT/DnrJ/EryC1/StrS family aminotransferase [Candidatus Aminicenantes bacterium]
MQFIDLEAQQKRIRSKIEENIMKVFDHGRYIMGPEIEELERKLADYVAIRYAVGVGSGTDALLISLLANRIGPLDAIFTSPFTFIATAEVIQLLGATPVFVDIESDTYNMDPQKLESTVRKVESEGKLNPRGIIPVDIFGQAVDYDEICSIAREYDLFVLEDAAQSFGGSYKGKKTCSLADIAATSFFPAKPLGAYGDGGMIFTDDKEMFDQLISIRVHGKGSYKYENDRVGINGRLDTIQAAILLAKFTIFSEEIELRQEVAERYNLGLKDYVRIPFVKKHNISAWAQYSVLHPRRDKIIEDLKTEGIPSAIYYPIPLHLQKAFSHLGYRPGDFPVSEKVCKEIFSLPMYPYLEPDKQKKIIDCIHRYV